MSEINAERTYSLILNAVEKKLKHKDSTSSIELDKLGKEILGDKFHGVYPSDQIPKLTNDKPYAIINLDPSYMSGSHWVSLVKEKGVKECVIYDSFGRPYKKIIPSVKVAEGGRILNTDKDAEQKKSENNCGQRSLAFLIFYDTYGKKLSMLI